MRGISQLVYVYVIGTWLGSASHCCWIVTKELNEIIMSWIVALLVADSNPVAGV